MTAYMASNTRGTSSPRVSSMALEARALPWDSTRSPGYLSSNTGRISASICPSRLDGGHDAGVGLSVDHCGLPAIDAGQCRQPAVLGEARNRGQRNLRIRRTISGTRPPADSVARGTQDAFVGQFAQAPAPFAGVSHHHLDFVVSALNPLNFLAVEVGSQLPSD